jgi:flotillin
MGLLVLAQVLDFWQKFLVPLMILLVVLAFVIVIRVMATRYKKIPPNQVGIFFGRKYTYLDPSDGKTKTRGFRIVSGGGSLLWPIVENLQYMSTAAFQTTIDETNIPNRDNVKVSVKGVATCKISTTPEDLHNAAMAFLGKKDDEIERIVTNILIGHLRSIIGKLDIDQILRQRDTFNKQVVDESSQELRRLGIQIITLVIQDVNDAYHYIDALGKKTVAEAIRDANIKVAEAEAETNQRVSDAQRQAAVVVAENAVKVAEAERDRDVKKAQFKVTADGETAKANLAMSIATTQQEQILKVRQAERDAAEKEAQVAVQQKEALRKEQELNATILKVADAERQRAIINAEAARQQTIISADATKQQAILGADAAREKAIREAEGQKQASTLTGEGEAAKTRATMLALADGEAARKKQVMLAEAEGQAALKGKALLAEAEGTQKLAEALAKMTADAKLILVLDRLPLLFEKGGDAASKVAASIFSSVAAPLGNIDELRIIDVGGTGRGIDQLSTVVPQTVFKTLALLQAQGVDVRKLVGKLGINMDEIIGLVGQKSAPHEAGVPAKTEEKSE